MASTLTAATYNLWGYGAPSEYLRRRGIVRGAVAGSKAATLGPATAVWAKRRPLLIAALQAADPDLIALQENVRRPTDAPERSHARQLGRALGMTVVEGMWHPWDDPTNGPHEAGVALLTHLPVEETREGDLPYRMEEGIGGTPRVLKVRVDWEGAPLWVWVAHFPVRVPEVNLSCAREVIRQAASIPTSEPLLLCGDLNARPDTPTIDALTSDEEPAGFLDLWAALHPEEAGFTMPTPAPESRIDYALLRGGPAGLRATSAAILGGTPNVDGFFPSDHCGLKVVLER